MSSIRFQFDEHVQHAVAHGLRRQGVDVLTAGDAGLLNTPDAEILAHAFAAGRVIVTHDKDFLRLHREQQPHAGIAYCAQRARSIGELIEVLLLIYKVMEPDQIAGQVQYL
ncbi:MAG: DUF5615 family PIN-like protein [Thermomicrobiales bacterium]